MESYMEAAVSSSKEAGLISLADLALSALAYVIFRFFFFDTLGFILLLEGAGLMLVGGALGFAGQPGMRMLERTWHNVARKDRGEERGSTPKRPVSSEGPEAARLSDIRAAFYMLVGVLLFLESLALTFVVR